MNSGGKREKGNCNKCQNNGHLARVCGTKQINRIEQEELERTKNRYQRIQLIQPSGQIGMGRVYIYKTFGKINDFITDTVSLIKTLRGKPTEALN